MAGQERDTTKAWARARLDEAHAFLRQAEMTVENARHAADRAAAASSAVLAAIAASDAACGLRLARVATEHDHGPKLLQTIPGSNGAVNAFRRLLRSKTDWQYRNKPPTASALAAALRQAETVVEFADAVARG